MTRTFLLCAFILQCQGNKPALFSSSFFFLFSPFTASRHENECHFPAVCRFLLLLQCGYVCDILVQNLILIPRPWPEHKRQAERSTEIKKYIHVFHSYQSPFKRAAGPLHSSISSFSSFLGQQLRTPPSLFSPSPLFQNEGHPISPLLNPP